MTHSIIRGSVLAIVLLLPSCRSATTDALDAVRQRGDLLWGADEEGGGPYVYRNDQATGLVGFEVELMDELCKRLGVDSHFVQCQWDDLLKLLNANSIDVVVNGYELTTERRRSYLATIPYYVYELHLLCAGNSTRLNSWDDLRRPHPAGGRWRIGVLTATAADQYLTREFADHVEVVRYNGTADAFRDVVTGGADATLTDTPAAVFYGPTFKTRQVGPAVQPGYYVIYLRPGQERLRDQLNEGIRAALESGRLKEIFSRYGIWNATQEQLASPEIQNKSNEPIIDEATDGNWIVVARNGRLLLEAAGRTVALSVLSMPLAIIIGLAVALGRIYGPAPLRWPLAIYVEVLRGTPLIMQLLFIYYGVIPLLHIPDHLRAYAVWGAAITGLAINYSAYESEIYRAGLLAIPVGQMEAALALGLTRAQAIWHIIVPQAVRLVVPPVTNDFINLFKDTSVCQVITFVELSKQYNMVVNNTPRAFVEIALVTALLYLAMSYPLALVARRLEKQSRLVPA